jgi:predicted DNA-binding protein
MEVHFSPELQEKLDETAKAVGRNTDELVQEVISDYIDELAEVRRTLDDRYDDIKSGRVKAIDGEESFARLRLKSEQRRGMRT